MTFSPQRSAQLVAMLRDDLRDDPSIAEQHEVADQLEAATREIAWLRDSTAAWLIEADFGGRPGWWSESDYWTGDAGAARRFGTEQEAAAYAKRKGVFCTGATEHVFAADRVELLTERDALRARLAVVEPVMEAAKAWHCAMPNGLELKQRTDALRYAIDAALAERKDGGR